MLQDTMIKGMLDFLCAKSSQKEKLLFPFVEQNDYQQLKLLYLQMGQDCQNCMQVQMQKQVNTQSYPTNYQKFICKCLEMMKCEEGLQNLQQIQQIGSFLLKNKTGIVCKQNFGLYLGEVDKKGKAEGNGRLIYRNYNTFEGQFKNNKPHGKGIFRDKRNLYSLVGEWQNGNLKTGKLSNILGHKIVCEKIKKLGVKKYYVKTRLQNQATYEGQIIQSNQQQKQKGTLYIIDGKGKMKFPDASSYDGSWCRGVMDGWGQYNWPDGSFYKGNYKNGLRNGKGKIFLKKENKVYEGDWNDGKPCAKSFINQNENNNEMNESNYQKNKNG